MFVPLVDEFLHDLTFESLVHLRPLLALHKHHYLLLDRLLLGLLDIQKRHMLQRTGYSIDISYRGDYVVTLDIHEALYRCPFQVLIDYPKLSEGQLDKLTNRCSLLGRQPLHLVRAIPVLVSGLHNLRLCRVLLLKVFFD